MYRIQEGGLKSRVEANRDVIEYPLSMLRRHWRAFHKKINGIQDDYRNNSNNFETKLMRLSENTHHFMNEIIDV